MANDYDINIPGGNTQGLTTEQERQVREIIAAALANYSGVVKFTTLQTTLISLSDFTNAQHNHQNTAGGGQLTDSALSTAVTVPKGGTGVNTITNNAIVVGQGAGSISTIVGKSGTGSFYVSASSGGAVTTRVDWDRGIITAIT